jgi:hypothetical protein
MGSARKRIIASYDQTEVKFCGVDLVVNHDEYGMSGAYAASGTRDDWNMLDLFTDGDMESLWEIVRKENGYDLSPADRAYRG